MKTENELKQIFVNIIKNFSYNKKLNKFVVWDKLVKHYTDFDGGEIVSTKIFNLIKIANNIKSKSETEFKIFFNRDLEADLWYVV